MDEKDVSEKSRVDIRIGIRIKSELRYEYSDIIRI